MKKDLSEDENHEIGMKRAWELFCCCWENWIVI